MLRLGLSVLVFSLSLATSSASAADTQLMKAFAAICLNTRGEAGKAAAVATASGWQAVSLTPAEAAGGLLKFGKVDGDHHWSLLLENSVKPADSGLPVPTRRTNCAVFSWPDPVDASAAVRGYLGVDPAYKDSDATWAWTYIDRGSARDYLSMTSQPATIRDTAMRALKSGPWVVVMAGPRGDGQYMLYSWVVKTGS